ncbi:MAG: uroporphyrinogen decarboxylase [Spirochaetaceae bacterium]|nr:MAG: uroporphyrinogen decarboxylase [Spirochaetaceae bacterium]
MNGKELITRAMRNEDLPRAPWVPYTGVQIATLKGYTATELLTDADKLFECLVEARRQYSPDGMPVVFDLQIEAEVLGCDLLWADDAPPTVKSHPLAADPTVPTKLPTVGDGRVGLIVDVMKRFRQVAADTALYGLFCGPFTLASHLRGTDIFMDMYDDPDYVTRLLDYCTDVAIAMADHYIAAGMDVLASVDPLVSQISPDTFEQFMKAPYTRLFTALREKGVMSSFFVCGDATKNIAKMCETGPDSIGIDENIDMVAAKQVTDTYNVVISGNIQLTVVMLLGNQMDAQKAALEKIDAMGTRNFILAPGCDMPYATPPENVIGVAMAVQDPAAARARIEGYTKADSGIDVELPDYANLDHVLIEVLTIDSATCAACGYMRAAADDMEKEYGTRVEIVEHKITQPENIVRLGKLGVQNLPTIVINGKPAFVSIIPTRDELSKAVAAAAK